MVETYSIPATRLRVLQTIPRLDGGGAEAATLEITRALSEAGGKSLVATQGGRLETDIIAAGGEVFHLPVASKNPVTMVSNISRLKKLCQAMKVDMLHARSRAPAWSALFAARQLGLPFLTTYHSKVHSGPRAKVFYNSVMTRGDAVIANSQYTADRIAAIHRTDRDKIHVVPRGCDAAAFDPDKADRQGVSHLRAKWGATDADTIFLCPARLTAWKGQDLLLQAMGDVLRRRPRASIKLVFAGDDQGRTDYRKTLDRMLTEQGLTGQVIFAGHVTNMPQLYAAVDYVVLPSRQPEPFGRTAIEAQAAAVPVIAADAGGFRETVKTQLEGQAQGWRVTPNDGDALAQALLEALETSAAHRAVMGKSARAYVAEHYSQARMCAQTLQIYQSLG